jgi:hypothetical protein
MGVRLNPQHRLAGARAARWAAVAVLVTLVSGALSLGLTARPGATAPGSAGPAAARRQQETTTTRPEVLVPGPTVQPTSTTLAPTTTTEPSSSIGRWARDMLADETGRTVAIAIGGLVLVALALAILTVRYWRRTRPLKVRVPDERDR